MRKQWVGKKYLGHNGLVGTAHPGAKRRDLRDGPRYPARRELQAGNLASEQLVNPARIRRGRDPAQQFSIAEQSAHNRRKKTVEPKAGRIEKRSHVAVTLAFELRVWNAHQQFHVTDGFRRQPDRTKVLVEAETEEHRMLAVSAVGDWREFQVVR